MQYAPMAAHAARFLNTTMTMSTPSPSPTPAPGNGFPSPIGPFEFYGCVASTEQFPTFSVTASLDSMSLNFCAASCPSNFFGVYDT